MLIYVIISLFLLFVIPLLYLVVVNDKKLYIPFIAGVIIYFLAIKVLQTLAIYVGTRIFSYEGFVWGTKLGYGLFMSLSSAFFVELIRLVILLVADSFLDWKENANNFVALGVGQGWISGIFAWGIYMWQIVYGVIQGQSLDYFGLDAGYMTIMLFECYISILFFIGLTFVIQRGISKDKIVGFFILALVINFVGKFVLYAVPYILGAPLGVTELIYGVYAVVILAVTLNVKKILEKRTDK